MATVETSSGRLLDINPAAGTPSDRAVAGHIDVVAGAVLVLKLDGSRIAAKRDTPIFETDIIFTPPGGGVSLDFGGAVAVLGGDARMLIEVGGTQPVFFMIQGQFGVHITRGTAEAAEQVTVRTPVSSVVLRHGRMVGRAAAEAVPNNFVLLPDLDGAAGLLTVTTVGGTVLLDRAMQATSVISQFRAPFPVMERTLSSVQSEFGGMLAPWLSSMLRPRASWQAPDSLRDLLDVEQRVLPDRDGRLADLGRTPATAAFGFVGEALGHVSFRAGRQVDGGFSSSAATQSLPPPVLAPSPDPNAPRQISLALIGNIAITGGAGADTVSLATSQAQSTSLTISADALNRVVIADALGNTVILTAVEELDLTLGDAGDRIVLGDLSGTDIADSTITIRARGGDDTVDGGQAGKRLVLFGDDGNDLLTGGGKNDDLFGGAGNDTLVGGAGDDRLDGGDGDDLLDGSAGNDTIDGASGADRVTWSGSAGSDQIAGGQGSDTLDAAVSGSVTAAKSGNAVVIGNGGIATATGFEHVRLTGGSGDDSFGIGNLAGTLDTLAIDGGGGTDTASFAAVPGKVSVDLASGSASLNGNVAVTLQSIESAVGSDGRDTLLGSGGADLLSGGLAADEFDGRGGDDRFVYAAGDGDDTIEGGSGTDTADLHFGTATVALSTVASRLRVDVTLPGPDDRLTVMNTETVRLFAGSGDDQITIGGNGSTIELGNLSGSGVATGGVQIWGSTGNDQLDASTTSQALRLYGEAGNDTLIGGTGSDTLIGGAGADRLQGSAGTAQSFRYDAASEGADTIVAFESGTDRLQVSTSGFGVSSVVQGQNFFLTTLGNPLGVSGPAFIFDNGTGNFAFDSDGDGAIAPLILAMLQLGTLQAADFQVF